MKAPRWTQEEYERYQRKRRPGAQVDPPCRTTLDSSERKPTKANALAKSSKVAQVVRFGDSHCLVRLKRAYAPPRLPYDDDRLSDGFAHLRDICASMCGFESDRAARGIQFEYSQEPGTEDKVVIEVYELLKNAGEKLLS